MFADFNFSNSKVELLYNLWNKYAKIYNLHVMRKLTFQRRIILQKILENFSSSELKECLKAIKEQEFLHNNNWFTLEWLSKEDNFYKVIEGRYKDSHKLTIATNVQSRINNKKRNF